METRRINYIDWLRVLAVLLLFPFHTGRVFNAGETFYAKSPVQSIPISYLLTFIDVWHMPLLFLLAGMSTYFALKRRSLRTYAGERTTRLGVPLLFGILVMVPPQTWYGARTNAGYTGSFLDYITSSTFWSLENLLGKGDYYGGLSPAHLWFILFLWLISLAALPLLGYGKGDPGAARLASIGNLVTRRTGWFLIAVVLFFLEALPDVGGKNIFFYFGFFALGYVIMFSPALSDRLQRVWPTALAIGLAASVVTTMLSPVKDALPDPSLPLVGIVYTEMIGAWCTIIGLLGLGQAFLDRPSPALAYLGESSYPVYILHQTVIVIIGFYLVKVLPHPPAAWPVLMVLAVPATFALYEVVRRIGWLRFLFGMKPSRPGDQTA